MSATTKHCRQGKVAQDFCSSCDAPCIIHQEFRPLLNQPINTGENGAGLFFYAPRAANGSRTLTLNNCTLENNMANLTAEVSGGAGGGIYTGLGVTSVTLHQLSVVNNSAVYGGALNVRGNPDVNISKCDFRFNSGTNTCMAITIGLVLISKWLVVF